MDNSYPQNNFQKMGELWLPYLPTLVPHIAELLEDEDEYVELEVREGLVRVIEKYWENHWISI